MVQSTAFFRLVENAFDELPVVLMDSGVFNRVEYFPVADEFPGLAGCRVIVLQQCGHFPCHRRGRPLAPERLADFPVALKHFLPARPVFYEGPDFPDEIVRIAVILDEFLENKPVCNQVSEAYVFDFDYFPGDGVCDSASHDESHCLRGAEKGRLQRGSTGIDHCRLRIPDYFLRLSENDLDVRNAGD